MKIREKCLTTWWTQAYPHPLQVTWMLPHDLTTRSDLWQLVNPSPKCPPPPVIASSHPLAPHRNFVKNLLHPVSSPPPWHPLESVLWRIYPTYITKEHTLDYPLLGALFSPDRTTPWSMGSPFMGPFPFCLLHGLLSPDKHLISGVRQDSGLCTFLMWNWKSPWVRAGLGEDRWWRSFEESKTKGNRKT